MNRPELVSTLELVGEALSGERPLVPIFECFCFKPGEVYAYNGELAISSICDISESFAVNGKVLKGLLQTGSVDDVSLKRITQDSLQIKCGKSSMNLPCFGEEDFVFNIEQKGKVSQAFDLDEVLLMGVEACLPTASNDQTQGAILGVAIRNNCFYSCDGDAVTKYKFDQAIGWKGQALLPAPFCKALLKVPRVGIGSALFISDDWAAADFGAVKVYGNLPYISKPFDYEGLIEETMKGEPNYVKTTTELKYALRRARVIADPFSAKSSLIVQKGRLSLKTETAYGLVNDTVPFDHPDIEANVSAAKLDQATSLCTEMAILPNCTVHRTGDDYLFQLVSNME